SRAPLPWRAAAPHGWAGEPAWLPFPPEADTLAVEVQERDPGSVLALYRRLLACRRGSPALQLGDWEELPSHPEVLAYRRRHGDDQRLVCVNFADAAHGFPLAGAWQVEVASDGVAAGQPYAGELRGGQALLLRPGERGDGR
ncbi:DUF3459 domain-containing protein, partial [Pseudomonas aeruginosa]